MGLRLRPMWQRIVSSVSDAAPLRLGGRGPATSGRLTRSSRQSVVVKGSRPTVHATDAPLFRSRFIVHHGKGLSWSSWRNAEEGFRLQSTGWTGSRLNSSVKKGDSEDTQGPVAVDYSSLLDEDRFHDVADDVLQHLQDKMEIYGDDLNIAGFDLDYASGVLTVRLGDLGTYVINKQTPNRQIWLSSPVSGPGRFDWANANSSWIYRRNNVELVSLLEKELSELLGATIDLS